MGATCGESGEHLVSEETVEPETGGMEKRTEDKTYTQAVLESLASNGQGLEQLGDGLAAGLRVACGAGRRALRGREI